MPVITVNHLTKAYGADVILDDISLVIHEGERVGLIGRNGAGKTTLFRILEGVLDYDSGDVVLEPGRRVGILSQIPVYPAGYTGEQVLRTAFAELDELKARMEALERQLQKTPDDRAALREHDALAVRFSTLGGYETDVRFSKTVNGLTLQPLLGRPFDKLSGGEKTRLNLGRLLLQNCDVLLLDEPTNHLDMSACQWLEEYLRQFHGTVLAVSHDRYFLDAVADRIIEIEWKKAFTYSGNFTAYQEKKKQKLEEQEKHYIQQQREIKKIADTAERLHGWGIQTERLQRAAFSMEKRIARMEKIEKVRRHREMKVQFLDGPRSGEDALFVRDLAKGFGGEPLFSNVSLDVKSGERIALVGDNGTGKTTLLRVLLGELAPDMGKYRYGANVQTGFLPQQVTFSHPERSLVDTLIYELNLTPAEARDRLALYDFRGEDVFKTIDTLSGGEKSRLKLCLVMFKAINFLLLDEPTNHLDIPSREWLESALDTFDGTMLFVTHDRYFASQFATRVWTVEDGVVTDFEGSFPEYLEDRAVRRASEGAAAAEKPEKKPEPVQKSAGRVSLRTLRTLEKAVADAEKAMEKCENELARVRGEIERSSTDYEKLAGLCAEEAALNQESERLLNEWTELSEKLAAAEEELTE